MKACAGETVKIIHRVYGREAFSEGALVAAGFVATAPAGWYDMSNIFDPRGRIGLSSQPDGGTDNERIGK